MKYQEFMVGATRAAMEEAFRYAKAVPADKVEWKPMDVGRSVLDVCRELAMCPGWAVDIIAKPELPEWSAETQAAIEAEQKQWTSVEACEAECKRRLEGLFELFGRISDEKLKETKWLPFDGGRDFTVMEMMDYPRWNFTYHLGQIAYIQILFGDRDMH
jgi:hypothetical protein